MPDLNKNIVSPGASITAGGNVHIGDVISAIETLNPKTQSFEKLTPYLQRQIFQFQKAPLFAGHQQSCNVMEELNRHTRIVLIGDAGMGKTTELERICYDLQESIQYYPVLRLLRNYRRSEGDLPIFPHFQLPPECLEEQEKFVLVLDGLDEPEMQSAKQAIEKFASDYPKAKIIVSCRSNAYADTLEGFEVYYLGKLTYPEIQEYITNTLGHLKEPFLQYWKGKYAWNPNQLIDNPFFLVRICEFVLLSKNPKPDSLGEVFDFLIEKALDARLRQISHISDNSLRKACRKSMEKLAFVMECRGENVISKVELEQLIRDKTEREVLLKKSSLIEFQDNSWRFAHNNFQEYLAAYALSKASNIKSIRRAIAVKPDYKRLKWSWTNALSFLLGLWEEGNPMKAQLLKWLAKSDLEALIKIGSFEKDRISLADRERVFRLEFENCKKEDRIVGSHHYNYWDMAEFGESANTVRYLTQELKAAKTHIVRGNALELLKSMNAYTVPSDVREGLRAELFRNIYDFEVNSPPDRYYAMAALFQLFGDLTNEEAVKMVETFFHSENAQERAASYRLIEKQKLQIYFMEQLIVRIQQLEDYNWQKGRALRSDEDVHIEDCFKDLEGEEVLVTFFEKYPVIVENKWDSRQKPLNLMLEKLANSTLSQQGAKRIFEAMKKRFSDWLAHPTEAKKQAIVSFIEKNGLHFEFFKSCIEENEIWVMWVSTSFLNEEGIIFLVDKFKKGDLDRQWMSGYQKWVGIHKKELLPPLTQRLNDAAEEPFSLPVIEPPIDYNQRQNEKLLAEKALYFNQEKYIAVIEKIFADFGKESFGKNEIYDKYPNKLIGMIDDHPLMTKDQLIEFVTKNWEWISINQIQTFLKYLQQEIEKNPELGLNEHELAIVKNWCDNHLPKIDWDGQLTCADVTFTWFTVRYHFSDYPESIYLQMVGSGLQSHIGTELDIIEFIQEQKTAPLEKLKARVLDNLRRGKAQGSEVASHLKFIEKQRQTSFILEALPALHGYIEGRTDNSNLRGYYQVQALKTFIALDGDVEYLKKLLEGISGEDDRENTLLEFFLKRKDKQFENILLQKLATSTRNEHQLDYANRLVILGNLSGLQFLVSYIEREKKSPFFTHGHNPEYQFENPAGIPLLLRFFNYGGDSSIPQDSFNRISNVGRNMLLHLASCQNRKYFPVVRNAIQRHLKWHALLNNLPKWLKRRIWVAQPSGLKELRYLLKTLEFQYYQKQEVPMAEAVKTWKELNLQNK